METVALSGSARDLVQNENDSFTYLSGLSERVNEMTYIRNLV